MAQRIVLAHSVPPSGNGNRSSPVLRKADGDLLVQRPRPELDGGAFGPRNSRKGRKARKGVVRFVSYRGVRDVSSAPFRERPGAKVPAHQGCPRAMRPKSLGLFPRSKRVHDPRWTIKRGQLQPGRGPGWSLVWGKLKHAGHLLGQCRSTPTRVGKTILARAGSQSRTAHRHACGAPSLLVRDHNPAPPTPTCVGHHLCLCGITIPHRPPPCLECKRQANWLRSSPNS
jgi:hypothetical protein